MGQQQLEMTLMIGGSPVTFTPGQARVQACMFPTPKPGRCAKGGSKTKKVGNVGRQVKVKPKQPPSYRGTSPQDKKVQERHAEVEKIMKKKDHHGLPTSEITKVMQSLGESKGWSKPNLGDMSVTYRGEGGDGEIRLVPGGWQAIAPPSQDKTQPALDKVFTDINSARTAIQRNAGAPRTRKVAA